MILHRIQGLLGNRINGVLPNQSIHIEQVWVVRIFSESNYLVFLWGSVRDARRGLLAHRPLTNARPEPCPSQRLSVTTAASARSSFTFDSPRRPNQPEVTCGTTRCECRSRRHAAAST